MAKSAGYSGKPLIQKLGIKPGARMFWQRAPSGFARLLGMLPPRAELVGPRAMNLDFALLFVTDRKTLTTQFVKLADRLAPAGMLWVAWPKKSSGVASDLDDNVVRQVGLAAGLVDVKVCAIDEMWSGLRFVIPLKDRPAKAQSNRG